MINNKTIFVVAILIIVLSSFSFSGKLRAEDVGNNITPHLSVPGAGVNIPVTFEGTLTSVYWTTYPTLAQEGAVKWSSGQDNCAYADVDSNFQKTRELSDSQLNFFGCKRIRPVYSHVGMLNPKHVGDSCMFNVGYLVECSSDISDKSWITEAPSSVLKEIPLQNSIRACKDIQCNFNFGVIGKNTGYVGQLTIPIAPYPKHPTTNNPGSINPQ